MEDKLLGTFGYKDTFCDMAVVVKTVLGSHFGLGEFTTHFRTYFRGDWDVHCGYGILTHGHIREIPFIKVRENSHGYDLYWHHRRCDLHKHAPTCARTGPGISVSAPTPRKKGKQLANNTCTMVARPIPLPEVTVTGRCSVVRAVS